MSRLMDKPLAAAPWLAIFGTAAQGVADDACRTPAAQRGSSVTPSVADARPAGPPTSCDSQGNSAAAAAPATAAPRYADAPKRSPHANPRSGRGSK
jgi:hypothetical protein